jgi:hypothetical protein
MDNQHIPLLVPISTDELWQKLREIVRSELQDVAKQTQPQVSYEVNGLTQKPIYRASEVCEMLKISRQTLHSWVKAKILKQYKIRSRTFYLWSDIEKLITPQEDP